MRVLALTCAVFITAVAAASAFSPTYEAANFAKTTERATSDFTPAFLAQAVTQGSANTAAAKSITAADGPKKQYGRDFTGNGCAKGDGSCVGDPRLYAWATNGYGIVKPVLFTARDGATLSGHIWMTKSGTTDRPGVIITGAQGPEALYWFAAQTLAKAGYVVMTFDPQGQGYSDTNGTGKDAKEGVPASAGEPFYDGTEDALDFFTSTPQKPYVPRDSCTTGTSHADKQDARVADDRASAYNPLYADLDTSELGLVGHGIGATADSYIGQLDPRVKAIVAYDNLAAPANPTACASGSSKRPATVPVTKPALGLAADYGYQPTLNTTDPTDDLSTASKAATDAGVDSGEIVIRGGTYYDFAYIPDAMYGATRRGADMVTWYTTAFFAKELRQDPNALAALRTTRWRNDLLEGAADPQSPKDPNLFSTYYKSRLDFGSAFTCQDLRTGCSNMAADSAGDFSYLAADTTDDAGDPDPDSSTAPAGSTGVPPAATGPIHVPPPSCRTTVKVELVHRTAHGLRIAGFAKGCPTSIQVAVALKTGKRCRYATGTKLAPRQRCGKISYLKAKGAATWILKVRGVPTSGAYVVAARAGSDGPVTVKRVQLQ